MTPTRNPTPFSGSRRTFTAYGSTTLPGTLLCDQSVVLCTNGADADPDGAHLYTADTLAFYAQYHGRDSLDDAKMIVDSTVNYGHAYANAFWNGSQAVYGAAYGYPRADDVVAGELTHGVTQFESGLLYYYQSGAINDSFSDVWGEFVDLTNNHGNDSPSVRWLHGEDVSGRGANRDLKNPPTFGDPDRMTSSYYYRGSADYYYGEGDNGGVHTNSGVNNKAAYLITDGGSFNGYTIRGLGIPKAAAIYYEAQTHLLTSGSDYADLYNALFQACQNVIGGPEGVTASDCLEVREATLATEMNLQPSSGYNLEAPVCPSGTARDLTLFSDDLEAGGANWTFAAIGGTSAWEVADFYAVSGTHMLGGNDYYTMSDSVAAMAADVALPSGAVLHFAHAYGFEDPNWDGGVLEYSTDGGGSWSDAGSLFSAGRGYGGTIYNGTGPWANPLSGRNAFIGDSHGYVSTRYDLSSLAGQSVRFRWRLGTDGVVFDWGWFVDDVEIYTCVGAPGVPALVSPASNALVSGYTPTLEWGDAAYADHYDLQVSTASDFSALVVDEDVVPSSFTFAAPLADNSIFWWRVRTVNQLDQASAWSAVRTFRTSPLIPLLVAPTDAETLLASRPTFDWSDVAGASNYTLQVSTGSTFATTVLNQTVVPSTYTMTMDLSPKGALMYWRVRANSTTGSSPWSSVYMLMSANPPSIPSLVSPATNTLAPSYTPTLDWRDASPGLDHYQLQVAKNNAFAGPVVDDSSLAASTYVFGSSLDPNATYYWRVRAFNAIGQYSAWSGTWTFRTLMSAPVLANPTSAEALLTTRPTFDWDDVLGASGYTLQVSTAASFSSTVLNVTASSSTYALTADLNPKGALLYWRVRANGTNGPSAWSEVRSLTSANPPSLPAPLAPASGALVLSYTPTLDWKDSTGGLDHYQLQVAGNSGFSGPVVDDSSLTSSIFTFGTPLSANTTYWWRLRSYNAGGQYSAWSAPWTFRTVMAAPTLMSPADAGTLQTTRPTFDWADGTSPLSSYNLQVSTVNTFATTVLNVKVTTSSYLTTADLTPKGALFYWRVRSNGANGPSPWSSVWTFTSANPPSIPGLLAPANGALLPTYLPTLDWADSTPALDHYQLQVADNSTFVGPVVDDSGLTASTYAFVSPLASNMTYYWRVRSFNTLGQYSRWSGARTFRTLILAPVLSSPSDGELLLTTRPTFDWGDVAGASGYTLQVSTVGSFASTVLAKNVTASTYPLTADLAPKNATLYWRVRANGTNGPSPWSETRSLTSANPPSVPALLLPASNGLVLTYTPVLDWSDSTGGLDHYQVQIAADSGFGAIVQDATTATSSHQPSPALSPNTKYWWRVRSINAGGQYSLWSAARYFRTVILPPSGLTSADASLTPRPTFDWGDVSGATDYTIQVSTSNGYATTVVNATVALSQYTPASDLPLGTTLYWRVRANGANGPSDWANGASFPSPIPPSLPVPMLPASNQLIMMYMPTLDWADSTRGLDHYQLQVASDGAFASLVVDDATLSVSTYTFSSALSPNSVFWWRVRSWNASGQYSAWSTVRSFRTVMITPSIAAPEDGATVTTRLPLLDWGDVAGATSYTVQVTATGSFSTPIVNASSSTSSYTPTSYLPILKVLQVRVRANGPNGPTAWSPTVSFMVIP